jgi:pimeloyl-ACP methyl ester carboxylesterase
MTPSPHVRTFPGPDGPPVVMLPGFPMPARWLVPVCEHLSATCTVHLVHLPNWGAPGDPGTVTLDGAHALLRGWLDSLPGPVALVGHSGGFLRGVRLARERPDRVTALLGVAGVAHLPDPDLVSGLADAVEADADLEGLAVQAFLSPRLAAERSDLAAQLRTWRDGVDPGLLVRELRAWAAAPDLRPALAGLPMPVHLCHGTDDPGYPVSFARDLAACAGVEVTLVEGAGHVIAMERPAWLAGWIGGRASTEAGAAPSGAV